jgi:hypothetical protein
MCIYLEEKNVMKPKNNKEIDVGIDSSFKSIRTSENNNIVYIDKTEVVVRSILKDLNLEGKSFHKAFLGPRRFGKSLTLDVIEHIFNGDRGLFEGTYLGDNTKKYNDKWWEDMSYPVVKIDFNIATISEEINSKNAILIDVSEKILGQLLVISKKFNLTSYISRIEIELKYFMEFKKKYKEKIINDTLIPNPNNESIENLFYLIIEEINIKNNNKGVVVLVDEYDKLATNFIDKPELFETIKKKLTNFYSVTKTNKNIKFFFLTGISRMGSNSLLSGMNHIEDLTFSKDLEPLLGISEEELEKYFDLTEEEHDLLKKWYNGYRFVKENKYIIDETGNKIKKENSVYCLYSTLHAIKNNDIANYWISTATPTMLTNYLKGMVNNGTLEEKFLKELYDNENYKGKEFDVNFLTNSIDIKEYDEDSLYSLLLQTGYLTIKDYDENARKVLLNYSNLEVKDSFKDLVKKNMFNIQVSDKIDLKKIFKDNDLESLNDWFSKGFNKINYDILKKENMVEGNVHLFFHAALDGAGISNRQSLKTRKGESDLIIIDDKLDYNYLFEFKIKENWDGKLDGVKSNEEYERYILGQCLEKGYVDNIYNNIYIENPKNKEKELIVVPVIVSKKNGVEAIRFYLCDYQQKELVNLMNEGFKELSFEELKDFYLTSNKKEIEKELKNKVDLSIIKKRKSNI